MGFFSSLANSAGKTLGTNLMGGNKLHVKETRDYDVGAGIAVIAQAIALKKQMIQAQKQNQIEAKQAQLGTINSMRFDGSPDERAENLYSLFALYKQIAEETSGNTGGTITFDWDKTRAAILEKAEFGIMMLRKVDADTADFFQKKFDEISGNA